MSDRERLKPFEIDAARAELRSEDDTYPLPAPIEPRPPVKKSWLGRFALAASASLVAILAIEAYDYVTTLIAENPLLGWPVTALLAATAIFGTGFVVAELRDIRRLTRRNHDRGEARRLASSELHGEAVGLLAPIKRQLSRDAGSRSRLQRYHDEASDALDDGERLRLFARTVLVPIDQQAYRIVRMAARDIGVLTALSPLGLLDGLLVLGRSIAMLRAIARLYGLRPGPSGTTTLLRRTLRNVALAGLGEIIADATVETLGATLASLLSARAGQGAANALLSAKLGLTAMELCRPLPFEDSELPSLRQLRKELLLSPEGKP